MWVRLESRIKDPPKESVARRARWFLKVDETMCLQTPLPVID